MIDLLCLPNPLIIFKHTPTLTYCSNTCVCVCVCVKLGGIKFCLSILHDNPDPNEGSSNSNAIYGQNWHSTLANWPNKLV